MEEFPEYKFTCSQAQQLAWLAEDYPALFEKIRCVLIVLSSGVPQANHALVVRTALRRTSSRWAALGSRRVVASPVVRHCARELTAERWQMDCNLPNGESLVRQFLYGQRFLEKHVRRLYSAVKTLARGLNAAGGGSLGARAASFGCPTPLATRRSCRRSCPVAARSFSSLRSSGAEGRPVMRMVRTRPRARSWNLINPFPHHTFHWEGLDGSRVSAHALPLRGAHTPLCIDERTVALAMLRC
jgi:alpha-mannosidase